MIPLLLWILSPHFPLRGAHGEQEILASVLFVLASITDGLDGYLARKRSQITTIGMLLDPIADKIMVTGALIALVAYNPQVVKVWIAVVIIGREFLISGLRSIASSEGFTIQASDLGKLKTVIANRYSGFRDSGSPLGSVAVWRCSSFPFSGSQLRPSTSRWPFRSSPRSTTLWASGSRSTMPRRIAAKPSFSPAAKAKAPTALTDGWAQKSPGVAGAFRLMQDRAKPVLQPAAE